MRSKAPYIVAALVLFVISIAVYYPVVENHPYAYDEADYMWAGKQGFWANYGESRAMSFYAFVKKGLELSHDSTKRSSFSQYIRSTGDIGMYRHYHGPMYAYWLSLWQNLGAKREQVFRGSGLLIHLATATLILFGMWKAFPSLPPIAGVAGCALYLFSRTALVAATAITQHIVFTFFSVATLFAASLFFRDLNTRWFYATMAALAMAFCTVETSALLVAAFAISLAAEYKRIGQKWPLRSFAVLVAKGIGVFALTMVVCWPKGLLELGIAKGFLTLVYISVYRKTFSPFGTLDLLWAKFVASPWEFSIFIIGVISAFVLWRRFADRFELLPWLAFIATFFLIMLKVTVPYTYYYAPLAAAFSVVTAVAFGILWSRWGTPQRALLAGVTAVCIVAGAIQYYGVARDISEERPYHYAVLSWVHDHPIPAGQELFLPYQLVPTLHYYDPELVTVGYDVDYSLPRLVNDIGSPQAANTVLCEQVFCTQFAQYFRGSAPDTAPLADEGPSGQPFYAMRVK